MLPQSASPVNMCFAPLIATGDADHGATELVPLAGDGDLPWGAYTTPSTSAQLPVILIAFFDVESENSWRPST